MYALKRIILNSKRMSLQQLAKNKFSDNVLMIWRTKTFCIVFIPSRILQYKMLLNTYLATRAILCNCFVNKRMKPPFYLKILYIWNMKFHCVAQYSIFSCWYMYIITHFKTELKLQENFGYVISCYILCTDFQFKICQIGAP